MTEPLRRRSHLDQALLTLGVALVVAELLIVAFGDDVRCRWPRRPALDGIGVDARQRPTRRTGWR